MATKRWWPFSKTTSSRKFSSSASAQRGVVGNVYKGRVSKVLPGMQSSFIDLGLERDGFLYVAEVIDTLEEFDKLEAGDEDAGPRPAIASGSASARRRRSKTC